MIDLEDELRSIFTEDAMEVEVPVEAPSDLRRRVRGRQARTMAGILSTAVGVVVILSAALLGARTLHRPLDGVTPASSVSDTLAASFSPGSPSWVNTIAEGDTADGHWTFGMGTVGNDTYFAYSNGDSAEVSVGHGGDFVPGPDGIRLLFPSPISGSSAEYAVPSLRPRLDLNRDRRASLQRRLQDPGERLRPSGRLLGAGEGDRHPAGAERSDNRDARRAGPAGERVGSCSAPGRPGSAVAIPAAWTSHLLARHKRLVVCDPGQMESLLAPGDRVLN